VRPQRDPNGTAAGCVRACLTLETARPATRPRGFYAALGYQEEVIRITQVPAADRTNEAIADDSEDASVPDRLG
jgi:hypothetical protein